MSKNPLFCNGEKNEKKLRKSDPESIRGSGSPPKLITSRESPLAVACQVWSTSVSAFVSYPVYRKTDRQTDRQIERSHNHRLVGGGNNSWTRGGASPKFWDAYLFLQPPNLTTSNLIHNLGLGSISPKLGQIPRFWPRGAPPKIRDHQLIYVTTEVSDFKFGIQLRFSFSMPKQLFGQKLSGS